MSENQLMLEKRTLTGKKLKSIRKENKIPAVMYGDKKEPILLQSDYVATEKVLRAAGYHSVINLQIDGKTQMAIVKNIDINPVSRRIDNVEFQAVAANKAVEATTPIVVINYETSPASKLHYALSQVIEEVDVKAKPSDLPKELNIDGSALAELDDKLTLNDIKLPKNVEFADKELDLSQAVATIYDPAAEAAAREAEEATEASTEPDTEDSASESKEDSENSSEESK